MKIFTVFLLSMFSIVYLQAQNYDAYTEEICICLKEKNVTKIADADPCINTFIKENLSDILKSLKIDNMEHFNQDDFSYKLKSRLLKNCEVLHEGLKNEANVTLVEKELKENVPTEELNCSRLHHGMYYYEVEEDTKTFVTFFDNYTIERMEEDNTFSLLKLKWKSDCVFTQTFMASNNLFKKSFSHPGDTYEYEIVENTTDYFIVKYEMFSNIYYGKFYKLK